MVDLAKKAEYYGIGRNWINLDVRPIINTPSYGNLCASFFVQKLKVASPKDVKQLDEVKELAYKEGFYQGTLCVGEFSGESVENAKPKVREKLLESGDAFMYAEPEKKVISRSSNTCIVAWMDQWYLDYGEESWKQTALGLVDEVQTWGQETKNGLQGVLNWLNQWACARSFGLGSKLPWDPRFLVESLSDSTIYMAYYTVAHFLHRDLFGKERGQGNIESSQMTDEVWDYIFCRRDLDATVNASGLSQNILKSMRREFEYFYALDMRSSGKDLISNHLTFFLYIHIALFPPGYWPKGIRTNGHLLLNGKKMSKSTGNFLTLKELVAKYGSDASRIAMADAGDGINDANLEENIADNNVLRLYGLREWCEEIVRDQNELRTARNSFQDALFENDVNVLTREAVNQYAETNYKLALKAALYGLIGARDFYREACAAAGIKMQKDSLLWYIEVQTLLLAVITPHWSEYIWQEVLNKESTIHNERFPEVGEPDAALSAQREYLRNTTSNTLSAKGLQLKKKAKGKEALFDPKKTTRLSIYMTDAFPAWWEKCVRILKEAWDPTAQSVNEKAL
jgi:leucyl-tRNA synthetase